MNKDALAAHAEAELNIYPTQYANPWTAACSSMFAFTCGALLQLRFIALLPETIKVAGTFIAVLVALGLTGVISAYLGQAPLRPALIRNVLVGIITMLVTFTVGHIVPL